MLTCDICSKPIEDGATVFTLMAVKGQALKVPTTNDMPHAGQYHLQCASDVGLIPPDIQKDIDTGAIPAHVDEDGTALRLDGSVIAPEV